MADYKGMYLTLFNATEKSINVLIEAQREVEELYISAPTTTQTTEITIIDANNNNNKTT